VRGCSAPKIRVIPAWAGNSSPNGRSWPTSSGHPRVGGEQVVDLVVDHGLPGSSPRGRGTAGSREKVLFIVRVIPAWAGNRVQARATCRDAPGHPRVGGEQTMTRPFRHGSSGSSPRGRGTGDFQSSCGHRVRVIPAWAGNSRYGDGVRPSWAGHPRVGGEQDTAEGLTPGVNGSSPRGRGTAAHPDAPQTRSRVIPAWAGNRRSTGTRLKGRAGHPRVGGEQSDDAALDPRRDGSSPRGRGTAGEAACHRCRDRVIPAWAGNSAGRCAKVQCAAGHPRVGGEQMTWLQKPTTEGGSSPRGRGTAETAAKCIGRVRVIPAWAGNSVWPGSVRAVAAGHPRVGGEQSAPKRSYWTRGGSSPRGRGTDAAGNAPLDSTRVIPAWAGNSRRSARRYAATAGHPRVGGEQVSLIYAWSDAGGSSPRGRGTGRLPFWKRGPVRVIPAWAGNRYDDRHNAPQFSGHPRVGGEQSACQVVKAHSTGSSPRGRGTGLDPECGELLFRVIPAWAGNSARIRSFPLAWTGHPRVGGEQSEPPRLNTLATGSSPRGRGTVGV